MGTGARGNSSPMGERFSLDAIIDGLASDLVSLRAGTITLDDARVRAELAKQIFNGVRLVINGRRMLEQQAKTIARAKENGA